MNWTEYIYIPPSAAYGCHSYEHVHQQKLNKGQRSIQNQAELVHIESGSASGVINTGVGTRLN
jgi:hypothetical protein